MSGSTSVGAIPRERGGARAPSRGSTHGATCTAPRAAVPPALDAAAAALAVGATDDVRACCRAAYAALARARPRDTAAVTGELMRIEARAAVVDGDPDAAFDALAAALAVAEATGDAAARAQTLNHLAGVHVGCGRLDEAERLFETARHQAVRTGERQTALKATLNLGVIANVRGDLRRAKSYYRRALVEARRLGAATEELRALNNLGLLHADLGQWDQAEAVYHAALALAEGGTVARGASSGGHTAPNDEALAQLHANLAEVWLGRGALAGARLACAAGVAASDRTRDGAHRGELHKMAGVVARESGALADADGEFAAAEAIARTRHDLLLLAETTREQGELYRRQGRNRDTLAAFNRAHALFRQLRAQRDLADVDRRVGRLEGEFIEVARRWGESIEAADHYTHGHCQRVADLACRMAEHAGPAHGFDAQTVVWYRIGALLHDVGKLGIPADVLNKPGKLTDEEFAMMRGHAEAGVQLLGDLEFPWDIRPVVLSHHERWDGKGYPHRLAGEAIPLPARVLAVADVYDALTSVRSYKRAMPHEDALAMIRQDAGTAFDPQVVAWFEAVAPAWQATRPAARADVDADEGHAAGAGPTVRDQRRAAGLDEVTGLPGRQAFFDEGARVLAARAGDGRPTTLLLLALAPPAGEGAVGETALAVVAEVISRNTRGGDFVGRYAAHEFVVLLPDTTAEEGAAALARLCAAVGTALRGGAATPATVAGTASTAPAHGATPDALLAVAAARVTCVRPACSADAPARLPSCG